MALPYRVDQVRSAEEEVISVEEEPVVVSFWRVEEVVGVHLQIQMS